MKALNGTEIAILAKLSEALALFDNLLINQTQTTKNFKAAIAMAQAEILGIEQTDVDSLTARLSVLERDIEILKRGVGGDK